MPYLLFLGCFAVYLRMMAPGIALEDSGEFATAAVTLSLTHPPGYPLYLMLGKVFTGLPIGSPGFRLAMMSAAAAAMAAAFVYTFTRELVRVRLWAAAAAIAFAFSPALAIQAVLSDKYALNMALVSAGMLLCIKAWSRGRARFAPLALLAGLALSHHMQFLYLAPAAAALLWRNRKDLIAGRVIILAALVVLPLSLKTVALPLSEKATPSLLFGSVGTAGSLHRYLSAKDYSGRFAAYSLGEKARRFWTHGLKEIGRQAGIPALALAAYGALRIYSAGPAVPIAGAACSVLAISLVSSFNIGGVGYYLLPVTAFLCALAGTGLVGLERRFGRIVALAAAVVMAVTAGMRGLPPADLSRYYGATDWGRNLLRSMAPGAVLVTQHDDDFYPPMYLQRVLGERTDVKLVHRPFLTRPWHHSQVERLHPGFTFLDPEIIPWGRTVKPEELVNIFLRSHLGKREIGFTYLANAETAGGFLLRPDGCTFKVGRRKTEPPLHRAWDFRKRLWRFPLRSAFGDYPEKSRFREVAGAYATLWTKLSLRWWDAGERDEARACLKEALEYPYTRVIAKDLEKVKKFMEFPD